MVTQRFSIAHLSATRYPAFNQDITGLSHSFVPVGKKKLASTGATTMEKINAPHRAKATVHAIGLKSRPSTACSVKIGRYAVMIIETAKNTGRCTSWADRQRVV